MTPRRIAVESSRSRRLVDYYIDRVSPHIASPLIVSSLILSLISPRILSSLILSKNALAIIISFSFAILVAIINGF